MMTMRCGLQCLTPNVVSKSVQTLVEYYEEEWGSLYDYEVVLAGFAPKGAREPEFV